jgi:hypothetical protein
MHTRIIFNHPGVFLISKNNFQKSSQKFGSFEFLFVLVMKGENITRLLRTRREVNM